MFRKTPDKLKKKPIKMAFKHLSDDYVAQHLCAISDNDFLHC